MIQVTVSAAFLLLRSRAAKGDVSFITTSA